MKLSKFIGIIMICTLIVVACCSCTSHIKDTNGDDNFSLATLTEEQVIKNNSSVSNVSVSNQWGNKYELKINKFSGVKELKRITVSGTQTITATVNVSAGNFRMVLVKDGKIAYDFEVNETSSTTVSAGTYIIKIAGESAAFNLSFSVEA